MCCVVCIGLDCVLSYVLKFFFFVVSVLLRLFIVCVVGFVCV